MRLFKKLRQKLSYLSDDQVEKIHQAYLMAQEAHRGQRRHTGEPYISHPVAVACILADMKMDPQTIMAALLHDVIEDTAVKKSVIVEKCGEAVANLVDGVSKLTQIEFVSRVEAQAENFRKMLLAMARDIRVIIVKLADRLHNMRTLGSLHSQKRRRIARETLEIFAPLARRLGMRDLSAELEELGFTALYPVRYRILSDAVEKARGNRKKILALIEKTLHDGLSQSNLTSFTIAGREKHIYSIYRKMRSKQVSFNEIMDVYAFRIIVDDVDSCYRVLGIVHRLFKPIPERFKDYIAIPKANGYQSLHTTLFGPYGLPIEVQIRTTEMDRMATGGIAAHWLYKTAETDTEPQVRAEAWVKSLLELQQDAMNPLEFIENIKIDLFPEEVYVFTPKGDILELPAGATALDFAYAVHTDIGNRCTAVKINRQLAPLSTPLTNGQTVEVITAPEGRPNPAWLDFIATNKARSGIRHFLKTQRRAESIVLGEKLLKKALSNYSLSIKKLPQRAIDLLLQEIQAKSWDDLLEEIGLGNRAAALVAQRLSAFAGETDTEKSISPPVTEIPLVIKGTEGAVIHFATCCYPVPGDPIIGVMEIGKGISVHVERCRQIAKLRRHPEHVLSLRWSEQIMGEFPVVIRIQVVNERGILAALAAAIADARANIEDINIEERDGLHFTIMFKIMVRDRRHLAAVLRQLRQIKQVNKIVRQIS